jgi:hypothetical protein
MDGAIEYKNKAYVFFEVKYLNKEIPLGQRLFLERLVKDVCRNGKRAIAIILEHSIRDENESVPVSQCIVREFFYEGVWRKTQKKHDAFELVSRFFADIDNEQKIK